MAEERKPDEIVTRAPAPKTRWGHDASGQEIQPPAGGLVFNPETGMAELPPAEEPKPSPKPTTSKSSSSS